VTPHPSPPSLRSRRLDGDDRAALELLIADDAGYSTRVHGRPPRAADAVGILTDRPPTVPSDNKHVLGLFVDTDADTDLVAVADVLRGYPTASYAYLGLLQVAGRHHGRGLGRALHAHVVTLVSSWPEVETIRMAVVDANRAEAEPFWRRLGYAPTGENRNWGDSTAALWELPLGGAASG
jgi:GNAT superfamily N-acetyltransferase